MGGATLIIDSLALLMILSACAAAGILLHGPGRREHERAERAHQQPRSKKLFAPWEKIHAVPTVAGNRG